VGLDAVIFDWGGTLTPWHTIDGAPLWSAVCEPHFPAPEAAAFAAALYAAESQLWRAAPHTFTDPDVPELLRHLRGRGIKVGVLSNTMWPREWHGGVFRRDGVLDLIDGAAYSSEIDWTKPHPEAFRAAMAAVGVSDPARATGFG
jgi:putative hydrolase of the HAD superfamily